MKILLLIAAGLALLWLDWFFSPERRLYQVVTELVGQRTAMTLLAVVIVLALLIYWVPIF